MIDVDVMLGYIRDANPIPDLEDVDADELAAFVAAAHTRRAAIMHPPTQDPTPTTETVAQFREYGDQLDSDASSLEDLTPTRTPVRVPARREQRGWPYAVAAAVVVLVLIGGIALLVQRPASRIELAAAPTATLDVDELVPVEGLATADGMVWAWNRDGQISAYVDGSWTEMPALPDPVLEIAGSEGDTWVVTTNRCDPSLPDWERRPCETALWRRSGDIWEQLPELGGIALPDDLRDLEIGPDGSLFIVTTEGVLYSWDVRDGASLVGSGPMNVDAIAITANGEGGTDAWASRFNPYFPDDIGFARLGSGGDWEAFNPFDGENHHTVMTTTPDGDLWVWISASPLSSSLSGRALAHYDSEALEWAMYESGIPAGFVRGMAASDEAVWLAITDSPDAQLWQFDGEAWTLLATTSGGEFLDVAVGPDGAVWYLADNAVRRLVP